MNQRLRELIKNRLRDRNMTQVELGEIIGLTSSQISRIISGDRGTTIDNLTSIADALGLDRDYVLSVVAGSTPKNGDDPWIEEQKAKLKLINPSLRPAASGVIDALVEQTEKGRPAPQPRKATIKT